MFSSVDGYGSGMLNIMRMMGQLEQGIVDVNQIEFPLTGMIFWGEFNGHTYMILFLVLLTSARRYMILPAFICLFVCLSVCNITQKVMDQF